MELQGIGEWVGVAVAAAAVLIGLVVGILIGRSRKEMPEDDAENLRRHVARIESQSSKAHKKIARMRGELDTVAHLALTLPQVVKDLNRDDIEPAEVPRLILKLAEAIFKPEQMLLYGLAPSKDGRRRVLRLYAQEGFRPVPDSLKSVEIGKGKIGWVADHELDMLEVDWATLERNDRIDIPANHAELQDGIIGPLVHHGASRSQVLGVLCIGGIGRQPRDEKLMFQMVTNFGCLALVNSSNMRQLRTLADHDGLTKLYNKRKFLKDLAARMLVDCEKQAQPFSIFIFDIDNFKTYNDTNGHPAGDALLRQLSGMIRDQLRPGDIACRYGGEEFVIAMPNTEQEEAYQWADQFRQAIADEPFEHREKQPKGYVSISGGIASAPLHGSSVGELVKKADETLYLSKNGGRDRIGRYRGVQIGDYEEDDVLPIAETASPSPLDLEITTR